MEIQLLVKRYHYNSKETQVLFSGTAELEVFKDKKKISYYETTASTKHKVIIFIQKHQLKIQRFAEIQSELCFQRNNITKGWIHSPYGSIDLSICTLHYVLEDDRFVVYYEIDDMDKNQYRICCEWS